MFATVIGVMHHFQYDFEIEQARRSLAMLPSGSEALKREEAIDLLERLRDATARLRRVEGELRRVLADEFSSD